MIASLTCVVVYLFFFFFNDTATTEIYTLSLHDALPISRRRTWPRVSSRWCWRALFNRSEEHTSELQSHSFISYAVFCLKKKTKIQTHSFISNAFFCFTKKRQRSIR